MIKDQDEGVLLNWTPYGKVREVHTKGDSINVYFRYDAAGNRVEKRVERRDTTSNVSITRYVRDASGNVMAVYNDSTMIEQPLYGSSRLGQYTGGRKEGYEILGSRKFELSNHLGNVLAVTTDGINVDADSTWTNVLSTSDYYPFGLEMKGRAWSDSTLMYRYGFNGKEKDEKGEFGNVTYDYGFRIYNPSIAKFLSVDPLTKSYPWFTPYQFAGNTPIESIDLDGAEELSSKELQGDVYRPGAVIEQNGSSYQYMGSGRWQQVYSGETREGVEYSTENLWADLPDGYNKNSGYTYLKSELVTRKQLIASNSPIGRYIQSVEKDGMAEPINAVEAEIFFGGTNRLRMIAFSKVVGESLMLSGGAQSGTRQPLPRKMTGYSVAPQPLKLHKSVQEALGENYTPVASQTEKINNTEMNFLLKYSEKGNWSKVYEAGYLNGNKIEVHYFVNKETGSVFDVKIKTHKWSESNFGKKAKGNRITNHD